MKTNINVRKHKTLRQLISDCRKNEITIAKVTGRGTVEQVRTRMVGKSEIVQMEARSW